MSVTSNTKHTKLTDADWYSASWNYFALLSGQRMQMLQFFISLEVFLCGSFITLVSLETRLTWAEMTVSSLIMLMSIVFRGLDYRTKTMIHECEKIMAQIEKEDSSETFLYPITTVNSCRKAKLTYTKWITILQGVFFISGTASFILVILDVI